MLAIEPKKPFCVLKNGHVKAHPRRGKYCCSVYMNDRSIANDCPAYKKKRANLEAAILRIRWNPLEYEAVDIDPNGPPFLRRNTRVVRLDAPRLDEMKRNCSDPSTPEFAKMREKNFNSIVRFYVHLETFHGHEPFNLYNLIPGFDSRLHQSRSLVPAQNNPRYSDNARLYHSAAVLPSHGRIQQENDENVCPAALRSITQSMMVCREQRIGSNVIQSCNQRHFVQQDDVLRDAKATQRTYLERTTRTKRVNDSYASFATRGVKKICTGILLDDEGEAEEPVDTSPQKRTRKTVNPPTTTTMRCTETHITESSRTTITKTAQVSSSPGIRASTTAPTVVRRAAGANTSAAKASSLTPNRKRALGDLTNVRRSPRLLALTHK